MKSKYLALGLSVVLALSLVSCGGQQAQEPQEPAQDIQQAEPVTPEPTVEPMEVKQEVKATDTRSAPVEGEQDTENEVDPAGTAGEAEPVEPAESPQEVTTTEPPKADTEPQQSQETVTQQQTQQQQSTQTQQSSTQKIDGHDDLGDYVLNGKGGKYYPALGITLPVSYDGTTTNGAPPQTAEEQEAAKKMQDAANKNSDWHTDCWEGITGG